MKRVIRGILALIIIGILCGAGWLYVSSHPAVGEQIRSALGLSQSSAPGSGLEASGTIEAETVSVTSEIAGRIAEIGADEGHEVAAGQVLVRLSTWMIDTEIKKAEASLGVAKAGLELAQILVEDG